MADRRLIRESLDRTQEGETVVLGDWVVLVVYAFLVLLIGARAGRGRQSASDLLVGGRRVPGWAVLFSMVATELSAATFIGVPHAAYTGDWTYLQFAFGALTGKLIICLTFLPIYHRLGVVTVYGFIEHRFGPLARKSAALFFVVGRIVASGVRLYIAALAFSVVTGFDIVWAIVLCGVLAGAYALWGGIRAVIWTDVLQGLVFVVAAVVAVVMIARGVDGGVAGILDWAESAGRDRVFHFPALNPPPEASWLSHLRLEFFGTDTTFWVALVGGCFLSLATHATDHDMVQRLLTTKNSASASRALLGSALLNFPLAFAFLFIGTGLAYFYLDGAAYDISDSKRIFPLFALHEFPVGLRGLIFAGLFAAAMSSLDSAICAIATTLSVDLTPQRKVDANGATSLRLFSLVATVVLILAAIGMSWYSEYKVGGAISLVGLALSAMTVIYGGLLGVFLLALVWRGRGSGPSVLAGLVTGTLVGSALFLQLPLQEWCGVVNPTVIFAWPWWIIFGAVASFGVAALGRRPEALRTDGGDEVD